jgi:hypothetical protein
MASKLKDKCTLITTVPSIFRSFVIFATPSFPLVPTLKGTVSQHFLLLVFFMNQFPPAPKYPIRTVSNFFENLQRYSQFKVHHGYQQHEWQICHRCQWHRQQKSKLSWHCPFKFSSIKLRFWFYVYTIRHNAVHTLYWISLYLSLCWLWIK